MIVPMKRLALLCVKKDAEEALEKLRSLGSVHIDSAGASSSAFIAAKNEDESASTALRAIAKAAKAIPGANPVNSFKSVPEIIQALDRRAKLVAEVEQCERVLKLYAPFGEVDPALAAQLAEKGLGPTLVKAGAGTALETTPAGAYAQKLSSDGKNDYWVVVAGGVAEAPGVEIVPMPAESTAFAKRRLTEAKADIAAIDRKIAASATLAGKIKAESPDRADRIEFEAVREKLESEGDIAWLEGWIPSEAEASLREAAKANSWGVMVREAAPDEAPPTLIRPPKFFKSVAALFKGLGVAPAYTEADVSVPFMCYFSVFFAMLVGDGGYGAIILALTLWGWKKAGSKAAARPWLVLMTVFSAATVAWGFLSNTWFGASIPFLANPASEWLGDPTYHNIMFLCFTIGVSHLVLARVWNGICKAPDSTCLAEFGWAGILVFMYFTTNAIVGIMDFPQPMMYVLYASLVLVFGFSVKPRELKTRGAELGMLPLNIMSALGDIISYVRLFAVGLASVKVAENFNNMAVGLDLPLWAKIVPMVLILLVGHGLNFAMAGLSVLVHAVRLNTLEFSNHKGVSWSGRAFKAFSKHQS